ncbi:MAG: hypothetical protein WCA78_01700, partial [Rhizomicrobium sp.]
SSRIERNVEITKSGIVAPRMGVTRMGPGDDYRDELFVFAPTTIFSSHLTMRVTLLSMEPLEREVFISINRTLHATSNTAHDWMSIVASARLMISAHFKKLWK